LVEVQPREVGFRLEHLLLAAVGVAHAAQVFPAFLEGVGVEHAPEPS
jgi:hypothetical protein